MDTKPKNPFWIRASYLTFVSIMGLFLTAASAMFLLLTTQAGLQVAVGGLERFSTVPISIEGAQGTLLGPFTIRKVTLYDTVSLTNIHAKWQNNDTIQLHLHTQLVSIKEDILTQKLPARIQNMFALYGPDALLENIHITVPLPGYYLPKVTSTFSLQDIQYSLQLTPTNSQIIGILTSQSEEKTPQTLSFAWQQQSNTTQTLSIEGNINLLDQVFSLSGQGSFGGQKPQFTLQADSTNRHFSFDYKKTDQNHITKTHFHSPNEKLSLHYQFGEKSKVDLQAHVQNLYYKNMSIKNGTLTYLNHTGNNDPSTALTILVDQAKIDDFTIEKLSATHQKTKSEDTESPLKTTIQTQNILYHDLVTANNMTLISSGTFTHQDITLQAALQQGSLSSTMTANKHRDDWQLSIQELVLPKNYPLIEPSNPKNILIEKDYLRISSPKKPANPPLDIDISYYFNKTFKAKFLANQLPLEKLPPELLSIIILPFDKLQGTLNGEVNIEQTQKTPPIITGNIELLIEQADIHNLLPDLPLNSSLQLKNGQLHGFITDTTISIRGNTEANQGKLSIDLTIPQSKILNEASIVLAGENIRFQQGERSYITIDPQLHITQQDNSLSTKGSILIHDSSYRSSIWQTSTQLPSETVIISKNNKKTSKKAPYPFDINVQFGPRTFFHAFGLHGGLAGDLRLLQANHDATIAEGSVHLIDGNLLIYNKYLPLNRCVFSWFENPISEPNIDLEIIQKDMTFKNEISLEQSYGVIISGPLDQLQFEFTSQPKKMTEPQILSALLINKKNPSTDNTESMDALLEQLNYDQIAGTDLSDVFSLLTAIRQLLFFDQIDIDSYDTSSNNDKNNPNRLLDDLEITLTKLLNQYFTIRVRFASNEKRYSKVSFDAQLNERMTLSSYLQNEGITGLEFYYSNSF